MSKQGKEFIESLPASTGVQLIAKERQEQIEKHGRISNGEIGPHEQHK